MFPLLPKSVVRSHISLPGSPCPPRICMWKAANLSWCCCSGHTQTFPPFRKASMSVFLQRLQIDFQCIFMCCSCHRIQTCLIHTHTHTGVPVFGFQWWKGWHVSGVDWWIRFIWYTFDPSTFVPHFQQINVTEMHDEGCKLWQWQNNVLAGTAV